MNEARIRRVPLWEFAKPVRRGIEIKAGEEYRTLGCRLYGQGVYQRQTKLGSEIKAKRMFLVEEDDLVINRIWAQKGSAGIVPPKVSGSIASQDFPTFVLDRTKVIPSYIAWYLKTEDFWEECRRHSHGTSGRQRVSPKEIPNITFPLCEIEEQRQIVSKIESATSKIEQMRTLKRETVEEAQELVQAKVFALFSDGKKKGWTEKVLGTYVVNDRYGTSERANDDPSGIPVLRMGNIQDGRIALQDLKYMHLSEKDRAALLLKKGDILVNRTNSAQLVGKCAVFDLDGDYVFASYLIRLRLDPACAEPRLVASYINSPAGRAYMLSERKQMTGQANVNATKLKALPIPLPSPEEQRRILLGLDFLQHKVEEVKKLQIETERAIDELIPSILARAYKGQL
jgi:type I restriction enzyme S subunit